MANLDYTIALLDAETPELRKLKIDSITVYNILFRLNDVNINCYFMFKPDAVTRSCCCHIYCRLEGNGCVDVRCNYFSVRTI